MSQRRYRKVTSGSGKSHLGRRISKQAISSKQAAASKQASKQQASSKQLASKQQQPVYAP